MSIPETVFCTVAIIGEGEAGIAAAQYLKQNGIDAQHFEVEGSAFGRTFSQIQDQEVTNEIGMQQIAPPPLERVEQSGTKVRIKASKIIFAQHVIMVDPKNSDNIFTPNHDFFSQDDRSLVHFISEGLTVMDVAKKVKEAIPKAL